MGTRYKASGIQLGGTVRKLCQRTPGIVWSKASGNYHSPSYPGAMAPYGVSLHAYLRDELGLPVTLKGDTIWFKEKDKAQLAKCPPSTLGEDEFLDSVLAFHDARLEAEAATVSSPSPANEPTIAQEPAIGTSVTPPTEETPAPATTAREIGPLTQEQVIERLSHYTRQNWAAVNNGASFLNGKIATAPASKKLTEEKQRRCASLGLSTELESTMNHSVLTVDAEAAEKFVRRKMAKAHGSHAEAATQDRGERAR